MVSQVLAAGVHGILLCHAESPAAIKAFVDSTRYPFVEGGVGRRGSGGQAWAAPIWGLAVPEYLQRARPWAVNPSRARLVGLKIQNTRPPVDAGKSPAGPRPC